MVVIVRELGIELLPPLDKNLDSLMMPKLTKQGNRVAKAILSMSVLISHNQFIVVPQLCKTKLICQMTECTSALKLYFHILN